jgi:nicotinamide-nucleotide amidase
MQIEIICTGDEVLTGKIVNTNFSYISQKLEDVGLTVRWGTTVGDDRETLLQAFRAAGQRADAVIVNGGLGPTVDDLSQEIAAQAAGVGLVLHEGWLARMEERFRQRGRFMPPNNRKQALLPAGAEMIDNAVGTACGFAVDIGKARFYFTPGVPRELYRMLEEQVLPRLLARSGQQTAIYLKRFHSYGLGESHVDEILKGVEEFAPDGSVKLGFRTHYPQLETKLTVRGKDMDDIQVKLAPVAQEVRKRLGNFIIAEDDQTLGGVVLERLTACQGSLAVVETFTGGQIAARLAPLYGAEAVFRRGIVARNLADLYTSLGLSTPLPSGGFTPEMAAEMATAARQQAGATHALAVLVEVDAGPDRNDLGGTICVAVTTAQGVATRRSRIAGGREWVRLGAIEMGLDSLRRYLLGLPVDERIDFERAEDKKQ